MTNPAEPFFDADAKIEHLIYIPGTLWDEEHQPPVFEDEFIFGLPEKDDAQLYKALPALRRYRDDESAELFQAAAALFGVPGFLVCAATPVRTYCGENSFYSGWGNYWTEWLYARTETDIARVVAEWAEERHAADKANSKAA
jgi:hypothetical protein